jgi:hypothetical protein
MNEQINRDELWPDLRHSTERSPLFWFLFENYERIVEETVGSRHNWKAACLHFAQIGLTSCAGRPVGVATAKLTWFRVKKFKKRLAALAAKNARAETFVARQASPSQALAVVAHAGVPSINFAPLIDHSKARREDDAPKIPTGARRFNDKYWIDKNNFVVPTDNRAEACLVRQRQYKESGRDVLTAITTLGPRTYFE